MGWSSTMKTIWLLLVPVVWCQSNYASQGNSIEYQPGLPPSTVLDGKVTKLDDISPIIFLNRTKAYLNCGQGSMEVELKFEEPFYGVAYADFDRNSACMVKGRGYTSAKLELPLKGCGTRQDPQRVFTNNVVVRFHPGLEMDGDEIITIVCRYPPPIAPAPPAPHILATPAPAAITEAPLKGYEILLIICTLLFLSLLLLGLGCSYICLRRRHIRVIHRQPFGSATDSEITKLSGSSLGNISLFEGLKIPRAHAPLQATGTLYSGSETNLVIDHSDTLPSDYPSESHSEVDEEQSLPVSSAGSYDNKAFIQHEHQRQVEIRTCSSLFSETVAADMESSITTLRHPGAIEPKFEVQMRVKRAPIPPASSPPLSESDIASIALERNLTTILEREESSIGRLSSFSYMPELHPPPGVSRQQTPPVYSRILRKQAEREITTTTTTTTTMMQETDNLEGREGSDSTHAKYKVASILAPTPPPPPPITPTDVVDITSRSAVQSSDHRLIREEVTEPLVEPRVVGPRRPEITTHEVDDVFLRTVTEKKTIEDVERHRRLVTEQSQPNPKWDVTIRNYPTGESSRPAPEWENFSDVSSVALIDEEPDASIQPTYCRRRRSLDDESSDSLTRLSRVLEPRYSSELSEEERSKWREIITTESTLRTLLTEANVKDDYELIRKDARYTDLFTPTKWDVIIRILGPPTQDKSQDGPRYKRSKSSEWESRSRKSSLPTLYEYESDGASSHTLSNRNRLLEPSQTATTVSGRLHRLSSLSHQAGTISETDLRSMSERTTARDIIRVDRDDLTSLSSFEGGELVRSLSQPELHEQWAVPRWTTEDASGDIISSTETTPRAGRRMTDFDEIPRPRGATSTSMGTFATRSSRYTERELSNVRLIENQRGASNWFHDDSEPEMQI